MRYQLLRSAAKDLKVLYAAFFANGMIHSILPIRRLAFDVSVLHKVQRALVHATNHQRKKRHMIGK